MEIILKQDIDSLGYKDDILKVKNGYGRNYLIPKGYAIMANESAKKVLAETLKQRAFKEEKIINEAQSIADKLKDTVIKVGAKVSSKGKIFGSVTPLQVAEAMKSAGFEITRKQVEFENKDIKSTGTYSAKVRLHKEVQLTVNFEVVEE